MYGYMFDAGTDLDGTIGAKIQGEMHGHAMPGLLMHLTAADPDGRITNIDVWESKEAFEAGFRDVIGPATARAFPEWGAVTTPGPPQALTEFEVRYLSTTGEMG